MYEASFPCSYLETDLSAVTEHFLLSAVNHEICQHQVWFIGLCLSSPDVGDAKYEAFIPFVTENLT